MPIEAASEPFALELVGVKRGDAATCAVGGAQTMLVQGQKAANQDQGAKEAEEAMCRAGQDPAQSPFEP